MKEISIVFINHTLDLSEEELFCFSSQTFDSKFDFHVVIPDSVDKENQINFSRKFEKEIIFLQFPTIYFLNRNSYSELLASPTFYEYFTGKYEFIMITQPDVLFIDTSKIPNLISDCIKRNIDYCGAPWYFQYDDYSPLNYFGRWTSFKLLSFRLLRKLTILNLFSPKLFIDCFFEVGNGGASLRRVNKFYDLSNKFGGIKNYYLKNGKQVEYEKYLTNSKYHEYLNEDVFWVIEFGHKLKKLNVAKASLAAQYFWELGEREILFKFINNQIGPLAIHKTYKLK